MHAHPPPLRRSSDAEKRQLQGVIEGQRRDVAALQRDVAGRDDAIAEKERRILDLKHKAQVGWVGLGWVGGWVGSCMR